MRWRVSKTLPSPLADLIPPGDHKVYEEYYREECTKVIRELFNKLIDKRIQDSIKKTDDPTKLGTPSYGEHQAYQSGCRQALNDLRDLLNR